MLPVFPLESKKRAYKPYNPVPTFVVAHFQMRSHKNVWTLDVKTFVINVNTVILALTEILAAALDSTLSSELTTKRHFKTQLGL